ncbi:putative peptidase S10, serine carboxypeptidase, alpha/Beta hydrolase [Helianthus annuus]|uniref:Peptidase S10, serine carboxypeptidase, alpha/Beta hydrolase n=1 Tax=Helianthus annuus TaxID=4232 RepID=A0A251TC47_HELAN|nr:serine carboxypeptidase-like 13 [Helianthus annuus]KAF5819076.1 putative peptidase S10, serine carboxypeptidase, alpha/Beta hydrolase [Helianthus annuus]
MKSTYIRLSLLIIIVHLTALSKSKSIIRNLPGFHGDLPFSFETGYVEVGDDNEIQFFYYFVESQRDPSHDPLLLYLTGGPGTPALYPFMYQIGPLTINVERSSPNNITLELNPNSLTKAANVLFLDLPTGVGFSYATTSEASRSSDSILALHTYKFLKKWLSEHVKFRNNPLYISGISYMGILVPVVTLEAYKDEQGNQPHLNIKGCLIISPLTDKFSDFNSRLEFAHRLALISDDIYKSTKESCNGNYVDRDLNNILCSSNLQRMDECTSGINPSNILEPLCEDLDTDPTCSIDKVYLEVWANDKEVQKALHVREGTVNTWQQNNAMLHYDLKKNDTIYYSYDIFSSVVYHKQLVDRNCQVLIINGDHDMNFPYVGTMEWISSLNLPIESPWAPWFVRNQVAGYRTIYTKNGYSLMHATVKGAGHSVALYKPEEAFVIVDSWLASHTYSSDY